MNNSMVWGRDQLMVTAAVNYCLGRSSYIVSDCVEWLLMFWVFLEQNTIDIIRRDVEAAFASGRVGMDIDRAEWEKVRRLWNE